MRNTNINYRFAVLLIVLIALALVHDGALLPVRVGITQFYSTTSYTIERFIFLAIGIFSGAYFGRKVGLTVLGIAFAVMLINAFLLDSGRTSALIETPFVFLTGLFIVFLFESRRKDAAREKALKEAQSLGRIGSWKYEIRTKKIIWSDEMYVLYEREPASGPLESEVVLRYYPPVQANLLKDIAKTAMESGQVHSTDIELELPSGLSAFHHVIINPEKNLRGNIINLSGTVQDVTEQKKVERIKDEFLGLVSHELRTPLTVIYGSLQVALDEKASPEETRELLQNAVENTEALRHILENMVELAKCQAGRLQLNIKPTDIVQISRKIMDKLREYGATQNFFLEVPEDLPKVEADPVRIERVLYNLLENAVKYSPGNSEIKVQAGLERDFFVLKIIDQGKGISEKDQENLFQLFNRKINSGETEGMGLGLVVCKRLLETHGGWIRVESEVGNGSTFTFGVPLNPKGS